MKKETWIRKSIGKRLLSLLMVLAMVITMVQLPVTAKADTDTYMGPTVTADGVTFYYYDSTNELTEVWIKGSWDSNWGAHIPLTKQENGTWSVTVPFSGEGVTGVAAKYGTGTAGEEGSATTVAFDRGKTYAYGFEKQISGEWLGTDGTNNPKVEGNSEVVCGPSISTDGIKLYYYPEHGIYQTVTVKYRTVGSSDDWDNINPIAMVKDDIYTAILSTSITNLEVGSYEYKLYKGGEEIEDPLNPTNTFKLGDIPAEDPNVQSPIVQENDVTFNIYAPTASNVIVKGSWNNWVETALTKNEDTGYWSTTISNVPKGTYQYGFSVDGNWTLDKLNSNHVDGDASKNNIFEVTNELKSALQSPFVNTYGITFNYCAPSATRVQLAGDMTNWQTGALDMIKDTDGNWTVTIPMLDAKEDGYGYKFIVDDSWVTDPLNSETIDGNSKLTVDGTEIGISPVVNGTDVTFAYEESPKNSEKVRLAGNLTTPQWGDSQEEFTYDEVKNLWKYNKTVAPGIYSYKFIKDADGWITDPANSNTTVDGNSKLVVSGLADAQISVGKNVATELPETAKYYSGDGVEHAVEVTYEVPEGTEGVTIADGKITINPSVTAENIAITMKSGSYEAKLNVTPVSAIYNYTIYYYDKNHQTTDSSDLWIWENNGAAGAAFDFAETEELSDGRTWLKANISVSYTDMGIIARSKGEWSWKGSETTYNNKNKDKNVTLYLVQGKSSAYTTLPEIVDSRERYVVIEYERPENDYDGWNIFSWNTGFGSETEIYTDDKHNITVPVEDYDVDLLLSFCMRKTTEDNAWAEKDGGDHYVNVPADQKVVKAKFVQGKGITEILPYNVGYEMDGANDQIHFYYRDDELFKEGNLKSLEGKVQVVVKGQTYDMIYDSENERYCYDLKGLTTGDYEYHYVVNDEAVLDAFNTRTTEDGKNSVLTYKKYNLGIEASVLNSSMDYNDNNVLSVNFTGSDAKNIATDEIVSIEADLSALGVGTLDVEPELMKGTISCLYSTTLGQKSIPVTLKDIYGHIYKATATVTIKARVKAAGDFDWDEAIIYFAVTDRFFDGSTSNNEGVKKDGSLSYHGGDFAGLNQKLDYLKDLGVNTIWITPIVENSDTTTEKDGETIESTGYHGYWASSFEKLNKHLGTAEEFSALLDAAHTRGIKIMVDVVINHAGYETEDYFNNVLDGVTMIRTSDNTVTGSDIYASLAGLPDFVTEDAAVRDRIVKWQTDWMDKYPIDYYRIDTVKHVDATTWAAFKNSLTTVNPDFKMTGEYAGAGYANTAGELGTGRMDALLDFDFNGWTADFLTGNIASIESSLEKRNSAINNTATMSSFINSHDENGLQYTLQNEKKLTEAEAYDLMKVAATLTITAKGQPVIYYGEELGQYGQDNYPYQTNRYDFNWDKLTAQKADSNSIYNHYKKMLAIRNANTEVFVRGDRKSVAVSDEKGYDVVSRSYNGTKLYVGMNIKAEAQTVAIPVSESNGTVMKDLYSEKTYTVSNGAVSVSIPAAKDGGTVVLKMYSTPGDGSNPTVPTTPTVPTKPDEPTKPSTPDNTTVTTNPDGTTTETKTETSKNEAGNEVTVTVTTEKDADGNVTSSKEVSVIADADKNTSATVTVKKDAAGNVTSAKATVAVAGTQGKTNVTGTISGGVVSQIVDSANAESVKISVTVKAGEKSYKLKADANELTAGAKLKVVAIDSKTKAYVLVNAKTYTVSKDGDVKVALPAGKTYELVTGKEASTIEKKILDTVKVKKASATVKKGKNATVQMSSKLDMKNVSKITYTTSKKSVATVNKNGKVTAKKAGTVTVKAKVTLKNGKTKTVSMKIKVK